MVELFGERWRRRERRRKLVRYSLLAIGLAAAGFGTRYAAARWGRRAGEAIRWALSPPPHPSPISSDSLLLPHSGENPAPRTPRTKSAWLAPVPMDTTPPEAQKPEKAPAPKKPEFIRAKNWIQVQDISISRTSKGGLRNFDAIPFHDPPWAHREPPPPPAATRSAAALPTVRIDSEEPPDDPGEDWSNRSAPILGKSLSKRDVDEFQKAHIDKEAQERLQKEFLERAERERWLRALLIHLAQGAGGALLGATLIIILSGLWRAYRRI